MDYYLNQGANNLKQITDSAINEAREIYKAGKNVKLSVSENKQSKSTQQRKYAHACISVIAKDIGYDAQRLKIDIKHKLGLIEKVYTNGEVVTVITSTEQLTKEQYGAFIEAILQLGVSLNINLPEPRMFGYETA
jgi:hypothetical protein